MDAPNLLGAFLFGSAQQHRFLDICNRPYEEIGQAAMASHERIYDVAAGAVEPFADAPEYLPMVFL